MAGESLLVSNTWLSFHISKGKAFWGSEICMWIETYWKVSASRYNAFQFERQKMGELSVLSDMLQESWTHHQPGIVAAGPPPSSRWLATAFAKLCRYPSYKLQEQQRAPPPLNWTYLIPSRLSNTGAVNSPKNRILEEYTSKILA